MKRTVMSGVAAAALMLMSLPTFAQEAPSPPAETEISTKPAVDQSEASGVPTPNAEDLKIDVKRFAGTDRYGTAIALTTHLYKDQEAEHIILASGERFPDAITAANLFGIKTPLPVLLTPAKALTKEVKDELVRIAKPKARISLVGGELAIDKAIEQELLGMGFAVTRLAGRDRQETAIAIADKAVERHFSEVSIVTPADDFALGVFGASLAARKNATHLLSYPEPVMQDPVRNWYGKEKVKHVMVLGDGLDFGLRASSYDVVRSNHPEVVPSLVCYPKSNCTESGDITQPTSPQQTIVEKMLATHFGQAEHVVIVAADKPVDGIAATQLAAKLDAPILPIVPDGLHRYLGVIKHLGKTNRTFYIVGGESAVEQKVADTIVTELMPS